MNISCIFKQALCLMSLLILTCDSRAVMNRNCSTEQIFIQNLILLNKTTEFKKLFPDDITNMKLLTNELKKEFLANCSTRHKVLSFYAEVLSEDIIRPEAQKSGIREAFLIIEDKLNFCRSHECELNTLSEEIKKLRNKVNKITLKEKLHKAISEISNLLLWINTFISKEKWALKP